jgi:hypothetical protein
MIAPRYLNSGCNWAGYISKALNTTHFEQAFVADGESCCFLLLYTGKKGGTSKTGVMSLHVPNQANKEVQQLALGCQILDREDEPVIAFPGFFCKKGSAGPEILKR